MNGRGSNVLTLGTFDLFHWGHVQLLRECALTPEGGPVYVAVNPDWFVEQYKGHPPVVRYAERVNVLLACRYVDYVIPNSGGPDAKPAIIEARPRVIVVGSDWKDRDYLGQLGLTQEWLDERGIRIAYVPYTEGISSTLIRERIA